MRMDTIARETAAELLAQVERKSWPMSFTSSAKNATRDGLRARWSARGPSGHCAPRDRWPTSCGVRPAGEGLQRIDPATRTFQALRIWVNRELDGLDAFLDDGARRLQQAAASR